MAAAKSQYYASFDPRQLSNCQLWLDADDLQSFTFSTGSNVSIWKDKSGNGYDASANGTPTLGVGPTGLTGVVFTGTQRMLGTASNTGTVLTGFAVCDMSSTAASDARIVSLATAGANDFAFVTSSSFIIRNGTTQAVRTFRNSASLGNISIVYNSPTIITSQFTGTGNNIFRNGFVNGTEVASTGNFGYTQYGLGNYPSLPVASGTAPLTGTIYEVILYNQSLTNIDRQTVEGYLAWKWGLNSSLSYLFSTHAYRRAPAVTRPLAPPDLGSNLALWLDAADVSTVINGAAGITAWLDKSGNRRHLVGTGSLNAPFLITSTPGDAYVNFTASAGQYLDVSDAAGLAVGRTFSFFIVENRTANNSTNYWFAGTSTTANNNLHTGYRADTTVTIDFFGNGLDATIPSYATNPNVRVWGIDYNGATRTIYANGSNLNSAANTTNLAAWPGARMGNYGPAASFYNGRIREVVWCTPSVSTYQRQQIEGYLAWKWNRESDLSTTHPFTRYYPLSPAFNPLALSNCQLWLDGADSTTITLSGSNITAWNDKTANGYNFTASGTGAVYSTDSNGLRFNSNKYTSTLSAAVTNETLFTVFTPISNQSMYVVQSTATGGRGVGCYVNASNYGIVNALVSWGSIASNQLLGANTRNLGVSVVTSGSNTQAAANGNPLPAATVITAFSAGNTQLGMEVTNGSPMYGDIYEVISYSRVLTSNERRTVEGYLAWKWGISSNLPRDHPYKTLRP